MTAADLAAALNGCERGSEITSQQLTDAATNNLVVVFHTGTDTKFCGAFTDFAVPTTWPRRIFFNASGTNYCGESGESWDQNHIGGLANCPNSIDVAEPANLGDPWVCTAPYLTTESFDVMDDSNVVAVGIVLDKTEFVDPPARRAK